jgi:acyl carrier protein
MWYSLHDLKQTGAGAIEARVSVSGDSPWFTGHFPDNPILPGIAQLHMAAEVVARSVGKHLSIQRVSRVKFKKIVHPDEPLVIYATATEQDHTYTFRITRQAEEVCSGSMLLAAQSHQIPMSKDIKPTITRIAEIIINELKLEDVTPATFNPDLDLVDEVGIDSMDLATIALVIRDEFGIRIDEDDYPKLTTIRIIAQYIADKQASGE